MEINEYQDIVAKTAVFPKVIGELYCTLGLCGEAGEVAEKVKKIYRDKQGEFSAEDKAAIIKEIGDVIWYCTALCDILGSDLSDAMQVNYNKLLKRRETNTLHGDGDNREEKA